MAVRLNKALKELNVGINTVAAFLQKKGMVLEDASPNAKITDEQYQMLIEEFGDDKTLHAETKLDIQKRKEKEKQDRDERKERERQEQESRKQGGTVFRTGSEKRQQFKVVGNINDVQYKQTTPENSNVKPDATTATAKPTETESSNGKTPAAESTENVSSAVAKPGDGGQTDTKAASSAQTVQAQDGESQAPAGDNSAAATATAEKKEDGIFRLETPDAGVKFKQVGFIDLSNLNSKTRPDKKSKAERKKEREAKERQRQDAKTKFKDSVMREIGESGSAKGAATAEDNSDPARKKKRIRISNERVDINAAVNQGGGQQKGRGAQSGASRPGASKPGKPGPGGKNAPAQGGQGKKSRFGDRVDRNAPKQELSDEDVAKQVKETLARLTSKQVKKGVKYRKEKRENIHNRMHELQEEENAESKVLKLTEFVTANELANMMDVPVTKVIGTCMSIGIMVSINQRLDAETINLVAEEFGYQTSYVSSDVSNAIEEEEDKEEDLEPRAPIITVMGHVDHGKTSLLDYIRKTNVIAGEAGGITQHIGAYNVKMSTGKHITFLDTPGHEAFTAMRARGAKVTDIAIIIIAADDQIMPQTKEAINHAIAANVPMVFAINKIDKPGANPEKIKEQLAAMNLLVEDWGGKYQSQDISAKKGVGVDELMEKVLLEAELLDLKANPNRKATGSVIESSLDKGRGYVATVLVQNGTLHQGDVVLAGTHYGKVKAMFNERGQRIKQALPAEPALILGLNGAPTAGDTFHVMDTEQEAREITNKREQLKREQGLRTQKMLTLDEVGRRIALGGFQELNVIVKGDVDGSIEALSDSLIKLSTEKIQVNVIHKAVGQISESDVSLAAASDAVIIGFQVRPSAAARKMAEQEGVDIRLYSIIYDAIEEVKSAMEGMLAPEIKEENTATIEVRQVYKITKVGTVAGAFVTDGKVHRSDKIRVIRDGIVVHTGEINALKRFKDDVKEVSQNFDCGISIVNYNDIREGDVLETYTEIEVKQKL